MENKSCYKNREISWLQFNERVLDEAGNPRIPLAERLSFVSIYQSNLDEFFMVRVGTLMVQMNSKEEIRENKTWMTSREQVSAILERVKELEEKRTQVYDSMMSELNEEGISIINFNRLSLEDAHLLENYFDIHIAPFLSPILVGRQQPFPFLNNKELYAIVLLENETGKTKVGIVPCANTVFKRLIEVPSKPGCFMLCEELILHFVSKLFAHYNIIQKSVMRITRNADIDAGDVYDEDLDYRNVMELLVKQRKKLSPVRLELSRDINQEELVRIASYLQIDMDHIIRVNTPLDLSFGSLLQAYLADRTELFYKPYSPRLTPGINLKESLIDQVCRKDMLLSYPFESMKPFLRLLREAVDDDTVTSIEITLYRVADRSKIIELLQEAAENGKKVVVLVELRARFDETNNIEMSKRLEESGCTVIYGLGHYKVHSKLCLITRSTDEGVSYITQIGTGNYNENTCRLYTDFSLITADSSIGKDAASIFMSLQQGKTLDSSSTILVAPKGLQNGILHLMDQEIEKVAEGKQGYIGIKINSLTDRALIEKLIEASRAGVKVELIVRGICCLIPGIPGQTDNITVQSIVGRYLEHSRIYRFGTGNEEKVFIASADFMTRNTTRRVEIAVPIKDPDAKAKLIHVFDLLLKDTENCSVQTPEGLYIQRYAKDEADRVDSHQILYEEAYAAGGTGMESTPKGKPQP